LAGFGVIAIVVIFVYIFYRIYGTRDFNDPAERLLAYTFVPVLIEMIGKAMSNVSWQTGIVDTTLCQAQTALVEFGNIGSILLAFLFAWNMHTLTCSFRRTNLKVSPEELCENLRNKLIGRELPFVLSSFFISLIFMGIAVPLACPRDFWCWVSSSVLYDIIFFYGWMWLAFSLSFILILYFGLSRLTHKDKYDKAIGITKGNLTAFSAFLVIDVVVWVISSANRFIAYSIGSNAGLSTAQALVSSGRGLWLAIVYGVLVYQKQFEKEEAKGKGVINDEKGV